MTTEPTTERATTVYTIYEAGWTSPDDGTPKRQMLIRLGTVKAGYATAAIKAFLNGKTLDGSIRYVVIPDSNVHEYKPKTKTTFSL